MIDTQDDRHLVLRAVDCDHYRATPVTDGTHMLFTNPATGQVCLGSDAPLGGPTKLLRKIAFCPPQASSTQTGSSIKTLPICYVAGQDLSWGLRIVVAYDDGRVVLFNVPLDLFEHIRHMRASLDMWDENAGVPAQSDLAMDVLMSLHNQGEEITYQHPSSLTEPQAGNEAAQQGSDDSGFMLRPFRSIQLSGVEMGRTDDGDVVESITVNCEHGGLKVWIFPRSGQAKLLDVYSPRGQSVAELSVSVEGVVRDREAETQEDSPRAGKSTQKQHQ